MKKFFSIIALLMLTVGVVAGEASAYSFGFSGAYSVQNSVLDFNQAENTPQYTSGIDEIEPVGFDSVLVDGSYVVLSPFTLNLTPASDADGKYYSFLNNPYENGFKVYNAAGTLLMTADITLDKLYTFQTVGFINAEFAMNLTDVVIYQTGSPILDAFVDGGAVNFTLNMAKTQAIKSLDDLIAKGGKGTYSATAAPAPVPEPSTVLLLGGGLLGMVAFGRKYMKK